MGSETFDYGDSHGITMMVSALMLIAVQRFSARVIDTAYKCVILVMNYNVLDHGFKPSIRRQILYEKRH